MDQTQIVIDVSGPAEGVKILSIRGDLTVSAEEPLSAAYAAAGSHAKTIILNMSDVGSIDSLGAGLLIALLARARKQRQRVLAYGLSEPCRKAFRWTHLETAATLYKDEAEALSSL